MKKLNLNLSIYKTFPYYTNSYTQNYSCVRTKACWIEKQPEQKKKESLAKIGIMNKRLEPVIEFGEIGIKKKVFSKIYGIKSNHIYYCLNK